MGKIQTKDTYALLDEGSTISLLDEKFAREVGLKGSKIDLTLVGIGEEKIVLTNCEKVDINVLGDCGRRQIKGAATAKNIMFPTQSISQQLVNKIYDATHVNVNAYYNAKVQVLIGQDNWQLIVTREIHQIVGTNLALSRTLLGWTVHGANLNAENTNMSVKTCRLKKRVFTLDIEDSSDVALDVLMKEYFELDGIGVTENYKQKHNNDRALKILNESSHKKDHFWETGLLWKSAYPPNVDSSITAEKRLHLLEKRLDRDPVYAQLYYNEMKRFINLGYAKRIDKNIISSRVWYLPHFGILNPNKPDKVRLVFDAAAKTAGISLNDQLDTGPDLLKSLPGILIRFRQYPVAVKGDISDMFLRVKVKENDRGAQRFLWRGADRNRKPDIYEMTTLIFGAKSSPCSAVFIKNHNATVFKNSNPDACECIINDSYMDDLLTSRKTERELIKLTKDVIKINAEAGFTMHSWASNSESVLNSITTNSDKNLNIKEMRLYDRGGEKVLGLFWNVNTDFLKFNVEFVKIPPEILNGGSKPTKRQILRVIMSVFDPLGLLAPFTIKSKIVMQQIWRSGVKWDEEIRTEEHVGWLSWISKLADIKNCFIPRCLAPAEFVSDRTQLHIFCDSSLMAYAAAAYLRTESDSGAHVSLIMAKSRVAPLKPLTVPRLELQAALLGARLARFVEKEIKMKIYKRFLWSDSITVVRWIKTEPRTRHIYVGNRLGEIAEISQSSEWRWIPTAENPADDATRFKKDSGVISSQHRWFNGPEFLWKSESNWPKDKTLNENDMIEIDKLESRKAMIFTISQIDSNNNSLPLRLLGWQGLLISARRVRKAFDRWRGVYRSKSDTPILDIVRNEQYWYRVVQLSYFKNEIQALKDGKNIKKNSILIHYRPYLDDENILRVSGRATLAPAEHFNNNPIILHSKHFATKSLIAEYHRRFYHGSNETVLNELRQHYYIVGLRNALRSIVSRCVICRLRRGKPQSPLMATLPAGRVAYRQRPFSHCGVDYFGPMQIKIGRRREKRWGVIFTCLATRAVHLELAHSLSSSSAIMALQRLASRRGAPLVVYSDNGTNFKGANKELKEAMRDLDNDTLVRYALSKRMQWRFNPPQAPHAGGAWERLIRSVKIALYAVLREQAPCEEVLLTLLAEVEHSINSRPLTHVTLDPRDGEALTPNHFLIGTSSGCIKLGKYDPKNLNLRKQWTLAQSYAEAFWKRWVREYLPSLLPRKKWTETEPPLQIGDIVMIIDLQSPRNCWRKGEITRIFEGADGQIRTAEVHTPMGDFTRSTRKLIKLLGVKEVQN